MDAVQGYLSECSQGHLHTYRFCDDVWTFVLQNAEYKIDNTGGEPMTCDYLKIVASDIKTVAAENAE